MKTVPTIATFLLALAILAAAPLRAEIEFSGYLKAGDATKFVLGDPTAQKKPAWFTLGGVFDGYTIIGFDAKKEMLAVEKAGATTYLPLKLGTIPQVAQTDEAQQNSPYTLAPQIDQRRRMEQVLDGERRSVLRRKSELDGLLDRVGNSSVGTGEALSVARPVRIGDPERARLRGSEVSVALAPFTFQHDSTEIQSTGAPAIPDSGRITIAPVKVGGGPVDAHALALDLDVQRERELRQLRSSPTAESQAVVNALEAEIRLLKQERAREQAQERSRIVIAPIVPEWERPDYVLRSYRERLQDLRTRYSEDHPWVQSTKASIERLEQHQQGAAPKEPPDSVKKKL